MSRLRPFLTVIIGLALGIGLGLYLGWVAWPTEFTDANPSVLQDTYRHDYVRLIATAYTADNNLPAAQQRVASLGVDGRDVVLTVTLETILQGGDEAEIRQLVQLAADLGLSSPAMTPYLPEAVP
jgi:hypothetical protein